MSEKKISEKKAKSNFSYIGLVLIAYILFVLYIPTALLSFLQLEDAVIREDAFLALGIRYILLTIGTVLPFYLLQKRSGLKLSRFAGNIRASFLDLFAETALCFAAVTGLIFISNMLFSRFGLSGIFLGNIALPFSTEHADLILFAFTYIAAAPIVEEYAFRGVLLNVLGRYGKFFALLTTSFLFALAHADLIDFLPAFALGYLLGRIEIRYHSIQPTLAIHILFNLFTYALCFIPPGYYMAFILLAVYVLAIVMYLLRRRNFLIIRRSRAGKIAASLFYSRFSVIAAILLMIGHIILVTFIL